MSDRNRWGAAIVGWQASWWVGVFAGAVVLIVGMLIRDNASYFRTQLRAIALVVATAAISGLVAFGLSFLALDRAGSDPLILYGNLIQDSVALRRAGMIHNFTYLGGLLGVLLACTYNVRVFLAASQVSTFRKEIRA
ncbi:hypothetical protein [Roseiconus lacunae]|uniref:hypothetical protein n=1 Tax=Roseiconus lacunae TaxID=2605694 RepID=UPI001359603C|nr:hypothetical protein [Roseiconus lacunae]